MTRFCICGVDPGLHGAVAFYWPATGVIDAYEMPVADGHVDAASLGVLIKEHMPEIAIVEQVGARPGQGVSSMFKFGAGYGMVRGVIAAFGVPLHLVSPSKWKKHYGLSSDKEASRAMALRLWPTFSNFFKRKKDEARAEACLIARYADTQGF